MKTLLSMFLLFLMVFALCLMLSVPAFAQESAALAPSGIPGLSVQQSIWVTWAAIGVKYLAEFYGSVRNGGGLRRILLSFWMGEQTPKVIAEDYKQELSAPKNP